ATRYHARSLHDALPILVNGMPWKSMVTENEMLLPSTLPSAILTSPAGPVVEPSSLAPSALKVKLTGTSPFGVDMVPVHLPSTSRSEEHTSELQSPHHLV